MTASKQANSVAEAFREADRGNTLVALVHLEKAAREDNRPETSSYLGYCLAKERGRFQEALALCKGALEKEPGNPVHYLNLGRVYLAAGRKKNAILVFRKGLRIAKNRQIVQELERLGLRKEPVISFWSRDNFLNKYLGKLLSQLGLR